MVFQFEADKIQPAVGDGFIPKANPPRGFYGETIADWRKSQQANLALAMYGVFVRQLILRYLVQPFPGMLNSHSGDYIPYADEF